MIKCLYNKVRSLIKASTVSGVNDTGGFRFGTIRALGKSQTANIFAPYGLIHSPPDGSMGVTFLLQGEESKSIVIADDPKNRVKGLVSGEVGIANYLTGTRFIMKENGDLDIQVNGNANVNVTGNLNSEVGGDVTTNAAGNITATAGENIEISAVGTANITAASVSAQIGTMRATIDGNGITVQNGDVVADGISLKQHLHGDVEPGAGDTGVPK